MLESGELRSIGRLTNSIKIYKVINDKDYLTISHSNLPLKRYPKT